MANRVAYNLLDRFPSLGHGLVGDKLLGRQLDALELAMNDDIASAVAEVGEGDEVEVRADPVVADAGGLLDFFFELRHADRANVVYSTLPGGPGLDDDAVGSASVAIALAFTPDRRKVVLFVARQRTIGPCRGPLRRQWRPSRRFACATRLPHPASDASGRNGKNSSLRSST